jgi:chemotaxis response regulator CheB
MNPDAAAVQIAAARRVEAVVIGASAGGCEAMFAVLEGLAGMRLAGALTIVQDPAMAEAVTMPEAAIRRMAPDLILPLAQIRSLLHRLGGHR